jgi:hypothetical protein
MLPNGVEHVRGQIQTYFEINRKKKIQKNAHPANLHENENDISLNIRRTGDVEKIERNGPSVSLPPRMSKTSAGKIFDILSVTEKRELRKIPAPGAAFPGRPASAPGHTGDRSTCAACETNASPHAS